MNEKKEHNSPSEYSAEYKAGAFLVTALVAYGFIRKGNYRAALDFYPRAGGGGLNFYKQQSNGKSQRFFGIDYHPVRNNNTKQNEWMLHYHRGESKGDIKKHRPYEGGW